MSKSASHAASNRRSTVPDHPEGRWCKECQEFKQLDCFRKGNRTYVCKLHVWPRIKEKRKRKFEDPVKHGLWKMWNLAYNDSRIIYGHAGQKSLAGQPSIHELCNQKGLLPSSDLRIVPINPKHPMIDGNMNVVDKEGRTMLVNIWRNSSDEQLYAQALQTLLEKSREKADTET